MDLESQRTGTTLGRVFSPRIVREDSPLSALQQRLLYIDANPHRTYTNLVENVPMWPSAPLLQPAVGWSEVARYAPAGGTYELIERLGARDRLAYATPLREENLVVTNGALHGLSFIFRAYAQPKGVALLIGPALAAIPEMLRSYGYSVQYAETSGVGIDLDLVGRALRAGVRLVYLNSPNNPTGLVATDVEVQTIADLAQAHGAALVVDLVYDAFVHHGPQVTSPLQHRRDWRGLFTVNSMSKAFGAPGLRVGWIAGAADAILAIRGVLERETVAMSGPSQALACQLLDRGSHELVSWVREGHAIVSRLLGMTGEPVAERGRGGTQLCYPIQVADPEAFADYALTQYGLALVTNRHYEQAHHSFVRIPLGCDRSTLDRGLALLVQCLADIGVQRPAAAPSPTAPRE